MTRQERLKRLVSAASKAIEEWPHDGDIQDELKMARAALYQAYVYATTPDEDI